MDVLNSEDRNEILIDLGLPPAPTIDQHLVVEDDEPGTSNIIQVPPGVAPHSWVMQQFDALKGKDGDGRSREQRSAYNKALYARLQQARARHNAAVRADMKADKVTVVSGEVAKRVRAANARNEQPVEIPDELLDAAAQELAAKLIAHLGQ